MSVSLDNTYLTNYSLDANDLTADKVTSQIKGANTDDETLDACRPVESYMIQQMYKNMEKVAKAFSDDEDGEDSSSDYVNMFSDNYLEEIANNMVYSGQGLGIAEKLYESIKANQGETVNK